MEVRKTKKYKTQKSDKEFNLIVEISSDNFWANIFAQYYISLASRIK